MLDLRAEPPHIKLYRVFPPTTHASTSRQYILHSNWYISTIQLCHLSAIMTDHYKPKLITLPGGDQARHRVLPLLLHSQCKAHPRDLTEYSTENGIEGCISQTSLGTRALSCTVFSFGH